MLHPLLSCVFALLKNVAKRGALHFTSREAYLTEANTVSLPLDFTKGIDLRVFARLIASPATLAR